MKSKLLVCSFLGLSALALVATTVPVTAARTHQTPDTQTAPQAQSISGKITAVHKSSFSLSVGSAVTQSAGDQGKTMTFAIDSNTTVNGKLSVGANADVTYRVANGQNVAVSVNVTQ